MVRDRELVRYANKVVAEIRRSLGAAPWTRRWHRVKTGSRRFLVPDPAQARTTTTTWPIAGVCNMRVYPGSAIWPANWVQQASLRSRRLAQHTRLSASTTVSSSTTFGASTRGKRRRLLRSTARQLQPSDGGGAICSALAPELRLCPPAGTTRSSSPLCPRSAASSPLWRNSRNATVRGLVDAWRKTPDAKIVAIRDNARMPASTMS